MAPGFEAAGIGEIMAEKAEGILSGGEALWDRLSREGEVIAEKAEDVLSGGDALWERLSREGETIAEKAEDALSGGDALWDRLNREEECTFRLSNDCGEDGDGPEPPDNPSKAGDTDKPPDDADDKNPEDQLTPEKKQDREIEAVENGEKILDTTQKKGNYGEMKTDQDLRNRGYKRISKDTVTSVDAPGSHGIDGVYHNPDGKPPYIIVDAKYDKAQLDKKVTDGPQMSQSWIDARLDDAVGKEKADEIRLAMLEGNVGCYVAHVAEGGNLHAPVTYDHVNENGTIVEKDVKINAA